MPITNPFKVSTPEGMNAEDAHALFVEPSTDFNKICDSGHTMVHGPRGCGKSMIFRYLLPDCQCLYQKTELDQLPFLAFLISIKNTSPNIPEFERFKGQHADIVLNEHVLTLFVASKVFQAITELSSQDDSESCPHSTAYFNDVFIPHLKACGGTTPPITEKSSSQAVFKKISDICNHLHSEMTQYARRLTFSGDSPVPYNGALCGYLDFLYPILTKLQKISFLPSGPIYLLFDDADYLNKTQTIVLNSWVSTRTHANVSIKISTQLRYKTWATVSGLPIQSPHDYQEINIADVYTTRNSRYLARVKEIVVRRLKSAGIEVSPEEFFPADKKQEAKIKTIEDELRAKWEKGEGRGHRAADDTLRYARPNFMKSLAGKSKSAKSYHYSGFKQLVHISSGLIRYFLEVAATMFDEQKSLSPEQPILEISPRIQSNVVREAADHLMLSEFEKIKEEEETIQVHDDDEILSEKRSDQIQSQMNCLYNLITALGGAFRFRLLSEHSERRIFSVAISGKTDPEITKIFDLGVRYGYFHRSSIGQKDGIGRTRLYVLTRRLAPFFNLDPTTFAGYLWMTSDNLQKGIKNPERFLRSLKKNGSESLESGQLTLFE